MSEEIEGGASATDGQTIAAALPAAESGEGDNTQPQHTNGKPAGYYPIDFETASPQEIKERHDYLYRQIKDQKRTDQTLRQYREIASEQSRRIEELTTGFTGVVGHLQEKAFTDNEAAINQTMQAAWEAGDTKAYLMAQSKLIDLKAGKKAAELQQKNAPKQEQKPQQPATNYDGDGGLSPEDQRVVDSWQGERDDSGQMLRPWAFNRSNDPNNPDPQYIYALSETRAVLMSPRFQNATMEEKMQEVDRRMGVTKSTPKQSVMGGGFTGARKTAKLTLSPKAQEIAVKTKFGGPQAKTDAEHIEAYRKQMETTKKGTR